MKADLKQLTTEQIKQIKDNGFCYVTVDNVTMRVTVDDLLIDKTEVEKLISKLKGEDTIDQQICAELLLSLLDTINKWKNKNTKLSNRDHFIYTQIALAELLTRIMSASFNPEGIDDFLAKFKKNFLLLVEDNK